MVDFSDKQSKSTIETYRINSIEQPGIKLFCFVQSFVLNNTKTKGSTFIGNMRARIRNFFGERVAIMYTFLHFCSLLHCFILKKKIVKVPTPGDLPVM